MIKTIIWSIVGMALFVIAILLYTSPTEKKTEKAEIEITATEKDISDRLYTLEWMNLLNESERTMRLRSEKEYKSFKKWIKKELVRLKIDAKEL